MRSLIPLLAVATIGVGVAGNDPVEAQAPGRLKGRVISERGDPLANATVHIEALSSFLGDPYAGQRKYVVPTDKKGEWALIGFKAGIWIFDASVPGRLPDAIALPITLLVAAGSGLADAVPVWHPILRSAPLPPGDVGKTLTLATDAAQEGRGAAVAQLLAPLQYSTDADVLTGAGHICLLLRDAAIARPFFQRALERRPDSFEGMLGMASTALMQRDYNAAARAFADARDRTRDKDERSYITVAIGELNKVHVTYKAY